MTGNTTSHARGDIGRRVARRREELGLSRDEVALRAGLSTGYLRFLEEEATAAPAMGTLRGLAAALSTTVVALNGGEADLPPPDGDRLPRTRASWNSNPTSAGSCWALTAWVVLSRSPTTVWRCCRSTTASWDRPSRSGRRPGPHPPP
ncbi:helix-turn-helix domain-containing protein [Streptomyces sp. NPDC088732]|uniref:helix-turn-helix domain-containing protein n=1 Tax=Streptomyces sp. NPDC088732 TaxID=3365879 RepID=UPI00380E8137